MPALTNQRQERFCQLVKQGIPPYRAFPMAGYRPHESAPYRLCGNVRIKRRIAELTRGLAVKTRVTVESITEELDQVRVAAMAAEQHSAAQAAIVSKAKLHGYMIDRKETGAPGEFSGLQTPEEVLALVKEQLGPEVAALISAAFSRQAADEAVLGPVETSAETRDPDQSLN